MVTRSNPRHCRHHRHLLCGGLLLRPLPRPALPEEGHRFAPSEPNSLRRGIVSIFCSCPHGTLCPLATAARGGCGVLTRIAEERAKPLQVDRPAPSLR
jgi:hypothetical protein